MLFSKLVVPLVNSTVSHFIVRERERDIERENREKSVGSGGGVVCKPRSMIKGMMEVGRLWVEEMYDKTRLDSNDVIRPHLTPHSSKFTTLNPCGPKKNQD